MNSFKRAKWWTALAVLLLVASALAACGDGKEERSKLLSAARASDLRSSLDAVEQMIDNGDCTAATNSALAFEQKVNALPSRLDASLRDALASGAIRLQRLIEDQCEPAGPTGPTVQAPEETDESQGNKGKGKGKGKGKDKKQEETPEEGTTVPTVPDENLGITTP
jgi:hypothetical protein